MSVQEKMKLSPKQKISWIITVLVPLVLLVIPESAIYTRDVKYFFAITIGIILWFAFSLTNNFIPAVLLPVLYTLTGVADASVAFSSWSSNVAWMVLCALLLIAIVERIGLLSRASNFVLCKFATSYNGLMYGIAILGILINLIFTGIVYVILVPIVYGICVSLGLKGTREGAGFMLAGMCAASMPGMMFYNPGMIGLAVNVMENEFGITIGWMQCLLENIIFVPFVFIVVFIVTKLYKPSVAFPGREYFEAKRNESGPISKEEKKAAILLGVLLLGLVTSGIHGIAIGWWVVLVTVVFYLPGVRIGNDKDISKINFQIVVFLVSCMGIGDVGSSIGVGKLIADLVAPMMADVSQPIFILLTWLLAVVANLIMTPLAAVATFSLPVVQIALDVGINPVPVIYTLIQGLDQVFFPYEFLNYLFAFSFGLVSMKQFIQFFTIKTIANLIFLMVIAVPFWMLIGLL